MKNVYGKDREEWIKYIDTLEEGNPVLFCEDCGEFDDFREFFIKEFKAPSDRHCKVNYDAVQEITEDSNTQYRCYSCGEEVMTADKKDILSVMLLHLQKNWEWSDETLKPEDFNPYIHKRLIIMEI